MGRGSPCLHVTLILVVILCFIFIYFGSGTHGAGKGRYLISPSPPLRGLITQVGG